MTHEYLTLLSKGPGGPYIVWPLPPFIFITYGIQDFCELMLHDRSCSVPSCLVNFALKSAYLMLIQTLQFLLIIACMLYLSPFFFFKLTHLRIRQLFLEEFENQKMKSFFFKKCGDICFSRINPRYLIQSSSFHHQQPNF